MNKFKISNITHLNGEPRTDGRYPLRIGSVVEVTNIFKGHPMVLSYLFDGEGNQKCGQLTTSIVEKMTYITKKFTYVVTTKNSIYYFERANDDE